jgi:hypothetical protein
MGTEPVVTILFILAALVYGAFASAFVIRTLFEGFAARAPWDAWRVLGLSLCLVWPIFLLAPLAQMLIGRKPPAKRVRAERPLRQDGDDRARSNG